MFNGSQSPTIAIIGSMRFYYGMIKKAEELHKDGYVVLLPFAYPGDPCEISEIQKRIYDRLIRDHINISDEVFVYNKDKYIGDSVRTELNYAISKGKIISYLEKDKTAKDVTIALIGSVKFIDTINEVSRAFIKNGISAIRPLTFNTAKSSDFALESSVRNIHLAQYHIIDTADVIGVVDVDGYIGDDTKREIEYAKLSNKKILYYSKGELKDGKIS